MHLRRYYSLDWRLENGFIRVRSCSGHHARWNDVKETTLEKLMQHRAFPNLKNPFWILDLSRIRKLSIQTPVLILPNFAEFRFNHGLDFPSSYRTQYHISHFSQKSTKTVWCRGYAMFSDLFLLCPRVLFSCLESYWRVLLHDFPKKNFKNFHIFYLSYFNQKFEILC